MKIKEIAVYQLDLPYSGGVYQLSNNRQYRSFDATFVKISSDNGLEGWGEATPFGANYIAAHAKGIRAGIEEIAPYLIGEDPRLVDKIYRKMDSLLCGNLAAKTAIDVACWDLFGKSVNMRVCDLLGGSTDNILPLVSSIPADDPDKMRQQVQFFRSKGYMGHSIKIGASDGEGGVQLDIERIKSSLDNRQKGEYFIVDANGGLTVEYALRLLEGLPKGLDFVLEAPCSTIHETLLLKQKTSRAIIMDELSQSEQSLIELIGNQACEGISYKISKNGGLTQGRRQRDLCLASGLTISVQDSVGSDLSFATIVQLAQTIPQKFLRCVLDTREMVSVQTGEVELQIFPDGVMAGTSTGLGFTPNLELFNQPVLQFS